MIFFFRASVSHIWSQRRIFCRNVESLVDESFKLPLKVVTEAVAVLLLLLFAKNRKNFPPYSTGDLLARASILGKARSSHTFRCSPFICPEMTVFFFFGKSPLLLHSEFPLLNFIESRSQKHDYDQSCVCTTGNADHVEKFIKKIVSLLSETSNHLSHRSQQHQTYNSNNNS